MKTYLSKVNSENYYAIFSDLTFKKYSNFEKAAEAEGVCVIKELQGLWQTLYQNSGNDYAIVDLSGKDTFLKERKWIAKLKGVSSEGAPAYVNVTPYFEITDAEGVVRTMHFPKGIQGIMDCFKLLQQFSKYCSWEYYDLFKENESLKEEITKLRKGDSVK